MIKDSIEHINNQEFDELKDLQKIIYYKFAKHT